MSCSVKLPCYEGFTKIAVWPAPESVSYFIIIYFISITTLTGQLLLWPNWCENDSFPCAHWWVCWGTLLSRPLLCSFPYHNIKPGSFTIQVRAIFILIFKVPTVCFYDKRPVFLVYHASSFHVMDFEVFQKSQNISFTYK